MFVYHDRAKENNNSHSVIQYNHNAHIRWGKLCFGNENSELIEKKKSKERRKNELVAFVPLVDSLKEFFIC